jgi:phage terminase small subunit
MATAPPLPLNAVARAFWDRHHDRLRRAGLLTDADVDSFAVLCVLWSKLAVLSAAEPGADQFREMVQLNQLGKQYHAYAREFGLLPRDRKRSKLEADEQPKKDEFGL